MAVELVTGYAGKAHVSSSEDGARQAGTVGTGMYVLETVDDPLKATLENANTVTIGPGDVLINGRHVQLTGSTTFAVPVGAQGQQTRNLLVLRYGVAEDGTEGVTAITLTGEPSASDPSDPALATGSILDGDSPVDMALYRVVTTGIESAQPVKLFETVPPIAGLTLGGLPGSLTSDQLPVVPVSKGGTGATSAAAARTALGLGALATLASPLPVANGGTGATTAVAAAKTLAFVRLAGQYSDARLEQQVDTQQGIKLIVDGAMRRMLVGADSYMGMWDIDSSSWLWRQTFGAEPVTPVTIGGDTTSALVWSDETYGQRVCVASYGSAGNWSAIFDDDAIALYDYSGAGTVAYVNWPKTLWSGTCGFGGSIPGLASILSRYKVALVQTSWSDTLLLPCSVTTGSDGLVHVIGSTMAMRRPGPGGAALTVNMIQSGTSMLAYASSHEYSGSWWDGTENHQSVIRVVGVA